jgi:hypothetical protein
MRLFHRSNSQGTFRLVPGVRRVLHVYFDKGLGEHTMYLPAEAQEFLARRLPTAAAEDRLPIFEMEQLDGLVPYPRTEEAYHAFMDSGDNVRNALAAPKPILVRHAGKEAMIEARRGEWVSRPDLIVIREAGHRPDYSKIVRSWKTHTPVAGDLDALVFRSADGTLEYTVLRDRSGRIWFGGVEDLTSEITTHGVRRRPVDATELMAPRFEYFDRIPYEFRGARAPNGSGHYFDQWDYLREIPEIQRFYRETGRPLPPRTAIE